MIIDECEQVIDHVATSTTMDRRNKETIYQLLGLCHRASTVILSDADISAKTHNFISEFKPVTPIVTITNTYKPRFENKHVVHLYKNKAKVQQMASKYKGKAYCFADTKAAEEEGFDRNAI